MSESGGVDGERELPAGWAWVRLDQVCDVSGGIQKQAKRRPVKNKFPFLRVANVGRGSLDLAEVHEIELFEGELERFRLRAGDLLVVEGNGSPDQIGRAATWHGAIEDAVHQNHLIKVRPTSAIDPRFLELLWNSPGISAQLMRVAQSTSGLYTLSTSKLNRVEFALPPLAEQGRIVEVLEEQLSRLDAAGANVRKVRQRTEVLLGRVTDFAADISVAADVPAAPAPEAVGSIDGTLPRIPADWRWVRLGELADVVGGVTKDKKKQSDPDLPEVPYLRVANVQRGHLDLEHVAKIRVPSKKADQLRLQDGDVLMNEGGDRDKLGRGWVWREEISNAIHQNHVFRARVRHDVIIPELLSWYANGAAKWFEGNGKQSTNLASISLSKIKKLPVPVPPRSEQKRIAERTEERLIQLRHAHAVTERLLLQGAKLRKALLRKAFQGGLVPQNDADEPATASLARIAAERAVQSKLKRPRRTTPKASGQRVSESASPAPEPTPTPALAVQQEFDL
ncbi:restriction endonuclease subunit S [Streptomyces sp. NPDC056039]|uniref:restriction endonuclease subunit S n=1 Tax=Streptomyces sp. NPDC056039 TaxID=3345687 RepID=UPI0035E16776